jgi:hypothetical protein
VTKLIALWSVILSFFARRPVGEFWASRAATADLIAERVCSLGWSISSSAAEALLELEILLKGPSSSNVRVDAGLWASTAAVAGSSGDKVTWAAAAANWLHLMHKTRWAFESDVMEQATAAMTMI